MKDDWTNPEIARHWSAAPAVNNPTRTEQLDILLSILEDEYRPGKAILDLGIGSGLVEEIIFRRIPGAYVVGVDASEAMIALARERLVPYAKRYEVVMGDITRPEAIKLPPREYQVAISVQTVHHAPGEQKLGVFRFVHDTLEPGGLFLLLDRIAVDTPDLFDVYRSAWKRLARIHGSHLTEGDSFEEHQERVAQRGDFPSNLEEHLVWLREAGFEATCIHLHGNRALLAARKK